MNAIMNDRCTVCGKPSVAMGFCSTHYAREKQKRKVKALNDIMARVEELKSKRPELADLLDDLTQSARPLYIDHRKKKPVDMSNNELVSEIATLKKEIGDLKNFIVKLRRR